SDEKVEHLPLGCRKFGEPRLQPFLQIFQNKRHQAHISNFVARERFADKLRAQRAQMSDAGSACERPKEADHEIDRMIRGKYAQVAHSRPEWIERRERDALLEI